MRILITFTLWFVATAASAQYAITSTGAAYSVSGTIGQHDAGGPMTGVSYSGQNETDAQAILPEPGRVKNKFLLSIQSNKHNLWQQCLSIN
jgi:hypothetical protein